MYSYAKVQLKDAPARTLFRINADAALGYANDIYGKIVLTPNDTDLNMVIERDDPEHPEVLLEGGPDFLVGKFAVQEFTSEGNPTEKLYTLTPTEAEVMVDILQPCLEELSAELFTPLPDGFDQFNTNVQGWGQERGIYEHSTILAQALKGVSEFGETADAIIKGERDNTKDGIGDTAVCLVHVARMAGIGLGSAIRNENHELLDGQQMASITAQVIADIAVTAGYPEVTQDPEAIEHLGYEIRFAMGALMCLADKNDLTFGECLEASWNEIKDRGGRMVAGGAFVKDEVATA